ncbi:MAG: cytochrome C oxidase subunit IV family protein [Chloroflexi bacterium]|nr:cytochrome C oxidase subunit IV family protein [Chloroflexota bacterium]
MEWAAQQGLDTAAFKKAGVKVYGKWYFPEVPAQVPLINLQTGERETFDTSLRAGQVLYAEEAELKKAGLGPFKTETPTAARVAAAPSPPPAAPPPVALAAPAAVVKRASVARSGYPATTPAWHHDVHEHAHPGAARYIQIALILTVLTAVEVAVFYIIPLESHYLLPPILLTLSVVKFALVAMFYMHLRFDSKLFTVCFMFGLAIAAALAIGMIPLGHDHLVPLLSQQQGAH